MSIQDYTGPGLRDFIAQTSVPKTTPLPNHEPAVVNSPSAGTLIWRPAIIEAAQQVLRDPTRLDPRWRDPLSPPTERHAAVVTALMTAIRQAREGQAPLTWAALREVPSTDEPTLLALYDTAIGWGPLQIEFDQPEVTEIKIIGTDVLIYPAGGQPVRRANPLTIRETEARARILAQDAGMPLNDREPARSIALGYGTRFTAVVGPRAIEPLLVFRRGRTTAWTMENLVSRGSLSAEAAELLAALMGLGLSGLVIGATASGKTAVLETLLATLPDHLITIEDGAQELMLPPSVLWTRQVVDVLSDQSALRDALRTVLRQTPRAVAVGECRGPEAGQILTLAHTDHQVWTTVHAEDGAGGLRRVATLASASNADYAGRFEDALHDAVHALPLLITTRYWGQIGRRLITAVDLATGVARDATGSLYPLTVPLVRVRVDRLSQQVEWDVLAALTEAGDSLVLSNNAALPERLINRLQQGAYRAWSRGETGDTPHARIQAALNRARVMLAGGQAERALTEARRAWSIRQDVATILPVVHQALERQPALGAQLQTTAQQFQRSLHVYKNSRNWNALETLLLQIWQDPAHVALLPELDWENLRQQLALGKRNEAELNALITATPERIAARASRDTLAALDTLERRWLSASALQALEQTRIMLLIDLVAHGEAEPQALAVAQATLATQLNSSLNQEEHA